MYSSDPLSAKQGEYVTSEGVEQIEKQTINIKKSNSNKSQKKNKEHKSHSPN